jgi:glycosyltransferase involved in cell wall biosynthesis
MIVSSFERKRLMAKGLRADRSSTVLNGIEIPGAIGNSPVADDHFLDTLRREGGTRIILTIAKLSYEKGVDVLLHSMPKILEHFPHSVLLIVGDGPERKLLENLAIELGINQSVFFMGVRSNVFPFLAAADAFVLSSRRESLPLAIREAMAMSKAVIATSVGGTGELIEDGVSGILVSSEAPDELADKIIEVLSDCELAKRIGFAGHDRIVKKFNLEHWAEQVEEIYRIAGLSSRRNWMGSKR